MEPTTTTVTTNKPTPTTAKAPNNGKRKARAPLPVGESREQKFHRLALARMEKLRHDIKMICNLPAYPHSEAQANRIMAEVQRLAEKVEIAFAAKGTDQPFTF